MAAFGDFTPVTFVNSSAPAINDVNLNAIEDLLALTDEELRIRQAVRLSEYIDYFRSRNTKVIDYFNDSSSWTAYVSTTLSDDTTNTCMNNGSVQILEPNNTASWIGMYKDISNLDLTYFENGEDSSSSSDLIMILFYVSDSTKFTHVSLDLGSDQTNNYSITYTSFHTGWNAIYPAKSDFTSNGTPPAWSAITHIRAFAYTAANAQNEFVSFQLVYMYRQDPIYSGYFNPFQLYNGAVTGWEDMFLITLDSFGLYKDTAINRTGIMKLDQISFTGSEKSLLIYADVLSFVAKFEIYCKKDGEGPSITWWVDANNYLETYVSSNTLYLYYYEAGVGGSVSKAFDNNIEKDERYIVYIEKNQNFMRVILLKEGESPNIVEKETTISASTTGYVYIGYNGTTGFGFITDFVITRTQGDMLLKDETTPLFIWKKEDQTVNNSIALVNDTNLWAYLRGNRSYHIEVYLSVLNASSSTPDVKISWVLTNCNYEFSRNHIGPPSNVTSVSDTKVNMSNSNITTAVPYGVVGGANETFIIETFRVDVLEGGGKVQLQWAQNTANASDTQILARSYMKITPIILMR